MNRKSIWDRLSDLDLLEGALAELQSYPDDDKSIVSLRALLLQLQKRLVAAKDKEDR